MQATRVSVFLGSVNNTRASGFVDTLNRDRGGWGVLGHGASWDSGFRTKNENETFSMGLCCLRI